MKRAFNINYDIDNREFINVRNVLSHEIEILQLVDLLIGAITYNARRYKQPSTFKNKTKNSIADYLLDKTKYSLIKSTPFGDKKFNLLVFPTGVIS